MERNTLELRLVASGSGNVPLSQRVRGDLVEPGGIEPPTSTLPVLINSHNFRTYRIMGMYWVTFFENYPLESDGNRIVFFDI